MRIEHIVSVIFIFVRKSVTIMFHRFAVSLLTKGISDTTTGFMDYKIWHWGGMTHDEECPIVQEEL